MADIIERYADIIKGVIGCYDRVVITGTVPGICYADGMTSLLNSRGIRIFDYTKWAEPLRELIRNNAEAIAAHEGLEIEKRAAIEFAGRWIIIIAGRTAAWIMWSQQHVLSKEINCEAPS